MADSVKVCACGCGAKFVGPARKKFADEICRLRAFRSTHERERTGGQDSYILKRDISKAREVDTYGDYILGICSDPRLRLSDGSQAVHLERRFTGSTLSHDGSHWQAHGKAGQADLAGGVVVEFERPHRHLVKPTPTHQRIEVRLEVEVKTAKGRISKQQMERQGAFQRRGGIYIVARSVDDAVAQILTETDRIRGLVG